MLHRLLLIIAVVKKEQNNSGTLSANNLDCWFIYCSAVESDIFDNGHNDLL